MAEPYEEEICCILEICCGGHQKRNAKAALAAKLFREASVDAETATRVAGYLLDTFDLAPSGSLKVYRTAVAEMAREYPYVSD